MSGRIDCEDCIYATYGNSRSGYVCQNKYANACKNIDVYNCEFFDEVSDNYIHDMDKVRDHT